MKDKAVVLFLLKEVGGVLDYLTIFKMLYFAQKLHIAKYGRGIVNDSFHAMENGPVLTDFYNIFKSCRDAGQDKYSQIFSVSDCLVSSKETPDMDELSESEVICIRQSIEENAKLSTRNLIDKSHDSAWSDAYSNRGSKRSIRMDRLKIAQASGISDDMIAYFSENEFLDKALAL